MAENPETRGEVVKKPLFGEMIRDQIAENYDNMRRYDEEKIARNLLLRDIVKRSKLWTIEKSTVTYQKLWSSRKTRKLTRDSATDLRRAVRTFLEDDQHSRLCAGKKEFVRKNLSKALFVRFAQKFACRISENSRYCH